FDVMDRVARDVTGRPASPATGRALFDPHGTWISWHPRLLTVAAAMRRPLIYLCWGVPRQASGIVNGLLELRPRAVLQHATTVAVNDSVTARAVRARSGRDVTTAPYVVDTDFFAPPKSRTGGFALV